MKSRIDNEHFLIEEMQAGSTDAFAVLYRHYSPPLYLNIVKMVKEPSVAEDLVQELFTRIWQRKELPGIKENFEGYLYQAAYHLVADYYRQIKREQKLLQHFKWLASENITSIEEALYHQHSAAILQKVIAALPKQQRRAYELVRICKHSYKEAAEIMGISVHTVKEYLGATSKFIQNYFVNGVDGRDLLLLFLISLTISG